MPSHKHRTTSKSGGSARSRKRATSDPAKNSSLTAAASFETVFGEAENPELQRLRAQLTEARARRDAILQTPTPTLALYRTRHLARLARISKHVRDLEEALQAAGQQKLP